MTRHAAWNERIDKQVRRACLLLAGIFLVVSVVTLVNPLRLLIWGRKTEAIITAVTATPGGGMTGFGEGGGGGVDAVDYRLIIGSHVVTNRDFLHASIYRPGGGISVLYVPSSPHVATARPLAHSFGGSVMCFLASLSFLAIHRLITGSWKPVW